MKNIFTTLILLFINVLNVLSQSAFIPQNLGAEINSTYDDINPVISPDGNTIYFVRVNHPLNTYGIEDSQDIWYAEKTGEGWGPAKRITELNIGRHSAVLSVLDDGKSLLVNGIYNKAGTRWKKRGISITTQGKSGLWSNPKPLKIQGLSSANSGLKSHASMSSDKQFLVFSLSRTYRSLKTDIFYSEYVKGRRWSTPQKIKKLSSKAGDDNPFLAPGNNVIYFSSDRKSSGQFDLYKSTKKNEDMDTWSKPELLSDTINSPKWEGGLTTNATGSWAYFSSSNNTMGGADIFKVKLFEENPFIVVSGSIKHALNKRKLRNKDVIILVDGTPADSVAINKDSATYTLTLPLGKTYSVATSIKSYTSAPVTIDAFGIHEFTKLNKDLEATPTPYVLVKGRLLTKSNQTIPPSANPYVRVNGIKYDSARIDKQLGTYEVKLKFGSVYRMEAAANGFNPIAASLDLQGIDEYEEMDLDLVASEEKFAVITGKILDKKTGKPIRSTIPVTIKVEGLKTVWADIDSANAIYTLRLPVGVPYTISASAEKYYPYYEPVDLTHESVNVKIYKDLTIVPLEIGQSIRLNNIFFESGKSTLKPESYPELNRVAEFLENNKDIKIEIAGHTDNVGKAAFNQKLSESRAAAVAQYIVSHGIPSNRIVSRGYGLSKPVASNATKEGKAQNRRVEFTILEFSE